MKVARTVARRAFAVAATVAALSAPGLSASADAAPTSVVLLGQTTATAVHITVTQQPASSLITASLFDDAVAYAASNFDSGGQSEALAAPAFPGTLVVQGPQLLCSQVFTCPVTPPDYPLLADASYPRRPRDSARLSSGAMGAGPFVITPLSARAQASVGANTSSTQAGATTLLAGTPGVIDVGASSATSTVTTAGNTLRLSVTSVLHDITVAGLLHIATVVASDGITVTAGGRPVDHPLLQVVGVTVSGQHATVDDHGVHVAGQSGGDLAHKLTARGVTVATAGAHRSDSKTGGRSDATGLVVDVQIPVSGTPYIPNPLPPLPPPFDQIPQLPGVNANGTYVAHVALGAVGAAAGIGVQPTFPLGGLNPAPGVSSPPPAGSQPTAPHPLAGPALVKGLTAQRQPAVAAPAPSTASFRGFADLLSREALEHLYAVLALGSLGLFVGWRALIALRRRPAGGSRA